MGGANTNSRKKGGVLYFLVHDENSLISPHTCIFPVDLLMVDGPSMRSVGSFTV